MSVVGASSALTINGTYSWNLASVASNPNSEDGTYHGSVINTNGTFDRISLSGTGAALTLGSSSTFNINFLNTANDPNSSNNYWTVNHFWHIVAGSFTMPTNFFHSLSSNDGGTYVSTAPNGQGGALQFADGGEFYVNYGVNTTDLILVWTPVPEPGSLLLGTLAALGLGGFGWRRRRQAKATAAGQSETTQPAADA
jgi:hypothetical protein